MGVIMHNNIPYGGGSAVEANVAGATPSENLSTLTIDGVTYDTTELVFCYDDNGSLYTDSTKATAVSGDDSKLYIATNTGKQYRYNGSAFSALGVNAINDLSDVTITSASDGQALEYDATAGKWKNVAKKAADTPTFSEASTRANISGSGETMATILGKIKKWFSDLKTVAFTGAYSDLSGTPTIPTVNNGTLTIQKNGTNVQTFSANQSGNATANIECATPSDVEGSKVATGNPLTVTDAAGIKAEKIEIGFEPKQAGSGTPSPSNIRPITGYTSLSADGCGKQLYSGSKTEGFYINNTGTKVSDQASAYSDPIFVDSDSYYTMSGFCIEGNAGTKRLHAYDINGNWISMIASVKPTQSNAQFSLTGLTPSNCSYVVMSWYGRDAWASHDTNIQLEKGQTATTYESYKGDHVTVQFGQTLYGGKLTILQDGSAEVYCDTGIIDDMGTSADIDWENAAGLIAQGVFPFTITGADYVNQVWLSEAYNIKYQSNWNMNNGEIIVVKTSGGSVGARLQNTSYNTLAGLKASLAGQKLVYALATPFTIHLSPVETLTLLQGINNVWTDGTTLSLTYQPDNAIGQAKGTAQDAMAMVNALASTAVKVIAKKGQYEMGVRDWVDMPDCSLSLDKGTYLIMGWCNLTGDNYHSGSTYYRYGCAIADSSNNRLVGNTFKPDSNQAYEASISTCLLETITTDATVRKLKGYMGYSSNSYPIKGGIVAFKIA